MVEMTEELKIQYQEDLKFTYQTFPPSNLLLLASFIHTYTVNTKTRTENLTDIKWNTTLNMMVYMTKKWQNALPRRPKIDFIEH